jgi:pimeloyl-ACP methyl ester carboxylesterase
VKTNHLLIALLLFIALLLLGCNPKEATDPIVVPDGAKAGELTGLKDCEFQPEGSKTKYAAECGTLVVPENWDKADSRLIALPVVRFPASGSNPAEPVFFLGGGPGESNLLSKTPPDWILKNHDAVTVGYRGVDGTVRLDCPEVNRLENAHMGKDLFSEQARAEEVAAVKQCVETFKKKGVDLSGFTIPGVVEDMEAARKALGYDQINLYSVSYGTRVAQIYAYMHPDSLYRLVLNSVNTPGHFIYDPAVLDGLVEHISELCAQDAACSSRTSDFAQIMYEVNHNMPKRWLFFNIDPDTIRLTTHGMFYSTTTMPLVFDAYLAAGEGDPSGLAMLNLMARFRPFNLGILGDKINKAGTVDFEKYEGLESISLGDSIMGAPLSELIWPLQWPIELISKDVREFQETDVEMLLVNGDLDFATPPTVLDEAKPYFHNAQMVLLAESSHTDAGRQPEAFERLLTSYYDTGVADSSLFVYQPLNFKPSMSLAVMAKLFVAAMIVLPALLVLGVVSLARRTLRGRRPAANH